MLQNKNITIVKKEVCKRGVIFNEAETRHTSPVNKTQLNTESGISLRHISPLKYVVLGFMDIVSVSVREILTL